MAGYGVQQETMAKGAAAVEEASIQIDGLLKKLDAEVQAMFGGWSSEAQRSFATLHSNWVGQQTKLTTSLREMQEALVATSRNYEQQEQSQASAFGSISASL
jgi:WXG100 family type VII secretion target